MQVSEAASERIEEEGFLSAFVPEGQTFLPRLCYHLPVLSAPKRRFPETLPRFSDKPFSGPDQW